MTKILNAAKGQEEQICIQLCFKAVTEGGHLIDNGRLFHSFEAATAVA